MVPGLRVRLRSGGAVVTEVGHWADDRQPVAGAGGQPPFRLAPCAFRAAVVEARRRRDQGVRLAIRGVDGDPAIDVGVIPGGQRFPGGILRVPCEGQWLYAFALCGDAARFAPLVEGVVGEMAGRRPKGRLGLRPDEALGTAVCFLEADGAAPPVDAAVLELLGGLLARFTVEEVCAIPAPAG
jgi:hypothetical protein